MPKSPTDHATKTTKPAKGYGVAKARLEDLDLPSGGLVQVRRPGLQGLIKAGILESLDTLTAIVATETIPKAKGQPKAKPDLTKIDAKQITDAMKVMDDVTLYVVVQPEVRPIIIPDPTEDDPKHTREITDDERDPDAYYIDDFDVEDKTFIVQYAMGGTRDLERFRAESPLALGSIPAGA
jgi:hypothetical protein